jgi:hypothetical protein
MPSQNGNGGRPGPWDSEVKPGSVIEYRVRQGQDRLNQILKRGGPRRAIVLAVLALVGLSLWDGLLHCAERLSRCRATFRQVS